MRAWAQSITAALLVVLVATLATVTANGGARRADSAAHGADDPGPRRARPTAADDRPNIVFVLTDDMRDDDLDHMPITRRLLADQGMEFTDAISPHPLCCPARAQLATGQYAQNNGVQHNRGVHGGFQALDPTQEASSWFRDARLPHRLRRQVPQRLPPPRRTPLGLVALGRADPRRLRLRRLLHDR